LILNKFVDLGVALIDGELVLVAFTADILIFGSKAESFHAQDHIFPNKLNALDDF
jgi:hypothetical protein